MCQRMTFPGWPVDDPIARPRPLKQAFILKAVFFFFCVMPHVLRPWFTQRWLNRPRIDHNGDRRLEISGCPFFPFPSQSWMRRHEMIYTNNQMPDTSPLGNLAKSVSLYFFPHVTRRPSKLMPHVNSYWNVLICTKYKDPLSKARTLFSR